MLRAFAFPTPDEALTARLLPRRRSQALELYGIYLGRSSGPVRGAARRAPHASRARRTPAGIHPALRARVARAAGRGRACSRSRTRRRRRRARRYRLPADHANVLVDEDHPDLPRAARAQWSPASAACSRRWPRPTAAAAACPTRATAPTSARPGRHQPARVRDDLVDALDSRALPASHARSRRRRARVADLGVRPAAGRRSRMARRFPAPRSWASTPTRRRSRTRRANAAARRGARCASSAPTPRAWPSAGPFDPSCCSRRSTTWRARSTCCAALREGARAGRQRDRGRRARRRPPSRARRRARAHDVRLEHRALPAGALADQPSAAIGTVIRADTVRALAADAGLARVDVLPVDGGFFRLYRLRPR